MVRAKATSFTTDTTYLTVQKNQILYFPVQFGLDGWSEKSEKPCELPVQLVSRQRWFNFQFPLPIVFSQSNPWLRPSQLCSPAAVSMTLLNQLLYIFTVHLLTNIISLNIKLCQAAWLCSISSPAAFIFVNCIFDTVQFSDQYNCIEYQSMSSCTLLWYWMIFGWIWAPWSWSDALEWHCFAPLFCF